MTTKQLVQNTLSQDSFLLVNKKILKELKNANTAVILSSLISKYTYFESRGELNNDYFFNTKEMLTEELGLSQKIILASEKLLVSEGFLTTKLKGLPVKKYYLINWDKIAEILNDNYSVQEKLPTKKYGGKKTEQPIKLVQESAIITNKTSKSTTTMCFDKPSLKSIICADSRMNLIQSNNQVNILEKELWSLEVILSDLNLCTTNNFISEKDEINRLIEINKSGILLDIENKKMLSNIKELIEIEEL